MTALTPAEAGRWAARSAVPLPPDRWAEVAATAEHIHGVLSVLKELDLGDTAPAADYLVADPDPAGHDVAGHAAAEFQVREGRRRATR
ncbi:hypothetical protein ACFV3R_24685 [Streptomyces sp. NPDC059740]|uniref:hypothetical protein n=1 Tax=Streptomyces sp. NPDC059740 TaxID=3346926 RepID=UPI0036515938